MHKGQYPPPDAKPLPWPLCARIILALSLLCWAVILWLLRGAL